MKEPNMDFRKIEPTIDVAGLRESEITIVGLGGATGMARDFARSGLGTTNLVDFDVVESSNLPRQDYAASDVGRPKAEALADELRRINPNIVIRVLVLDFTRLD
jgi:sulfur carrier protein ThiS adenylyltransferase